MDPTHLLSNAADGILVTGRSTHDVYADLRLLCKDRQAVGVNHSHEQAAKAREPLNPIF